MLGALEGDKEAVPVYPVCLYAPNLAVSGQAGDR